MICSFGNSWILYDLNWWWLSNLDNVDDS